MPSNSYWVTEWNLVFYFASESSKINNQLFILGLHWLDVKPQAKTLTSCRSLNTHFRLQIQQPGTRKINKYIFTILHCNAPDFKYVRFIWPQLKM